jgi:hypothetical protein
MHGRLFTEETCSMINNVPEIERGTLFERLMVSPTIIQTRKLEVETHNFQTHCADNACLSYAVSALQSHEDMDESALAKIKTSLLSLSALKRLRKHSPVSRSYLQHLRVEDMENLRAYAREFSSRDKSSRCEESLACYSEICAWKDRLFLGFLSLVLPETTAEDGTESLETSRQAQEMFETFLESLKESSANRNCCLFSQLKDPERTGGLVVHGKPKPTAMTNTDGSSHEWRSKVASLLLESAQTSHETVIQQMQAICQDFETRCMKVEEPLAIVIQERDQFKQQLENSKNHNLESEDQARQSMELVSTLKKQIDVSAKQINEYSFQVEHLTDQVDALQTELDDTRRESQETIEVVRSKARNRELDLMATVAERDDLLEEQQIEIDAISKEREQFKETIDTASEHHRTLSLEYDTLRQEIARLQKESELERDTLRHEATKLQQVMDIRESTNTEKDNQIMALGSTTKDLRSENQMLKDQVSKRAPLSITF